MKKLLVTAALVGLVALIAGPATAGGKGKGPKNQAAAVPASIRPNQTDLHHGDAVSFSVAYSTDSARIWVRCWQDGAWVYQKTGSEFAEFVMWSPDWAAGGGNCAADLYHDVYQGQSLVAREWLAQATFSVAA